MPSTVIRRFDYRPDRRILEVTFTTGRRYRYLDVPQKIYRDMRASFSKGEYFNRCVKPHFAFERVS
jgi:hypothetical protein